MKLGMQTILWGLWIDNIVAVLDTIAAAGFEGVEFAQRPSNIRAVRLNGKSKPVGIDELLALMNERNLTLVGLSGGTLRQRTEYCGSFRPQYLYVEDWDESCDEVMAKHETPFVLALHPHMYKRVHRLAQAAELLAKHEHKDKKLHFIPDTAHLFIAGDSPVEAVKQWRDRIAAVHLKDWSPESGRSSFHYAKGFVGPGQGKVPLEKVLAALDAMKYEGWLIAEQDSGDPHRCAEVVRSNARWLRAHGYTPPNRYTAPHSSPLADCGQPFSEKHPTREFLAKLINAAGNSYRCHQAIAEAFHELIPSHYANVWTYSPAEDLMCLKGLAGSKLNVKHTTLRGRDVLSGDAIREAYAMSFDLEDPEIRERFGDPEVFQQVDGLHSMISIPVPNLWNINHLWLLVNVFPKDRELSISLDELMRHYTTPVAEVLRCCVEERCLRATTHTNYLAAQPMKRSGRRGADDFLDALCDLVKRQLDCQAINAFLVNDDGSRLEHRSGNIRWLDESRKYYTKDRGITGRVWRENETFLTIDFEKASCPDSPQSIDIVDEPQRHEALYAPITRLSGRDVIGVLRCRNRNRKENEQVASMFTPEDAAVVESIVYAAAPHLELLKTSDSRVSQLKKLVHELGQPLVAIRGTVSEFADNTNVVRTIRSTFSPHDYLGDVVSWCDLMSRLLIKVSLNAQFSSGILKLRPDKTRLAPDVVAPAARRLTTLLKEYGFAPNKIRRGDWGSLIPPLYIDRNMFQEVAFNLLENAIKYGYKDPCAFLVEIDAADTGSAYELYFRDYGPGIPKELRERVFEEWFRGADAEDSPASQRNVIGQGLGLWFVRSIVEAHGGKVFISRFSYPTEFTISLPKSLASSPPNPVD